MTLASRAKQNGHRLTPLMTFLKKKKGKIERTSKEELELDNPSDKRLSDSASQRSSGLEGSDNVLTKIAQINQSKDNNTGEPIFLNKKKATPAVPVHSLLKSDLIGPTSKFPHRQVPILRKVVVRDRVLLNNQYDVLEEHFRWPKKKIRARFLHLSIAPVGGATHRQRFLDDYGIRHC